MKKTIRYKCFENNSSSMHSLVVSDIGLKPSNLPLDSDGYIVTDFGDFGDYDMGITAFDQATKLSYLATECYYINHWDENIEDSYAWKNICEAICDYTGANGVKLLHKTEPVINHQSIPAYGELKFCDYWDKDSIINFIFNELIGIKMSHD